MSQLAGGLEELPFRSLFRLISALKARLILGTFGAKGSDCSGAMHRIPGVMVRHIPDHSTGCASIIALFQFIRFVTWTDNLALVNSTPVLSFAINACIIYEGITIF